MTTQAQIEAAAKAIMKTTYPSAEAQAKAALTAAHEAWLSETFSERWQAAKDRAAAAEVGPSLQNLPPEEQRKAHKWMDSQLVAAIRKLKEKP